MHQLHIQVKPLRATNVVHLHGAIDSNNFAGLVLTLNQLFTKPAAQIILECSQVSYIGTAELKELLDLAHIARARGGDIKCARLAPTIEQVATLIANGDPLECFPDVSYALASFHSERVPA
jgi:anti-anti-sigma factor